jgi:hypothetical protein
MIVVTGAAGQLGRLVIAELLHKLPPSEIVAAVRNPAKAQDLATRGVDVRLADYDKPDTLVSAFKGAERVVMISTSEVGNRVPQHRAVIDAAKGAGAKLVAYTSILRADTSPLGLGREHRETEALLRASGVPFVLLRNGWYTENYAMSVAAAVQHGVVLGCAGDVPNLRGVVRRLRGRGGNGHHCEGQPSWTRVRARRRHGFYDDRARGRDRGGKRQARSLSEPPERTIVRRWSALACRSRWPRCSRNRTPASRRGAVRRRPPVEPLDRTAHDADAGRRSGALRG